VALAEAERALAAGDHAAAHAKVNEGLAAVRRYGENGLLVGDARLRDDLLALADRVTGEAFRAS
jgi:hypothetical protein